MVRGSDNALTNALVRATIEPSARSEFLDVLMSATVFVLGKHDGSSDGLLPTGTNVMLETWLDESGAPFTPFFASLEALAVTISEPREYLALPAMGLFELTKGQRLILYAGGGYGKEFLPREVEELLASSRPT